MFCNSFFKNNKSYDNDSRVDVSSDLINIGVRFFFTECVAGSTWRGHALRDSAARFSFITTV